MFKLFCPEPLVTGAAPFSSQQAALTTFGPLQIHYINVGWGGSVLIKGPDGTTVLLEAGETADGTNEVVPYLKSIGIQPATGLDYMIAGHQHCDHIGGMDEVITGGYNVRLKNYYNGSSYTSTCVTGWNNAAATTTAGAPTKPVVGSALALGNGAKLTFVVVNGAIIGGGSVSVSDENDRSIGVLVQYGGFDYLWASDLGGGDGDQVCTGRSTSQVDVESAVIAAISPGGSAPRISAGGIDVMNVNHHGSESSTNANWMNACAPSVALISVGGGQSAGWDLPRKDVVEKVLLGGASSCATAPPALVLQTEEGPTTGAATSVAGYCVGNIVVSTDGVSSMTVAADGMVNQGPIEVIAAGLPRTIALDDVADSVPPTTSITAPAANATVSGLVGITAAASDNASVARVELWRDGVWVANDTSAPYAWTWDTTLANNGSHTLQTVAYDPAGNLGSSAVVAVTVSNMGDTTAPSAPANLVAVGGKRKITLTWGAASDNVGVTGYRVSRSSTSAGTYTQIATTTALTYVQSGLTTGAKWFYSVKAVDAAGNVSAASNVASATVK